MLCRETRIRLVEIAMTPVSLYRMLLHLGWGNLFLSCGNLFKQTLMKAGAAHFFSSSNYLLLWLEFTDISRQ